MNFLRKILFPFAILYGFITSIRNFLFDCGILKSYSFPIPVIAVGNLSVGGTGKTPQIEYLIRLLSDKYNVATLSRGYKRKSEGFILANVTSNSEILGDEPFQFYKKFPNIQVAVDANRKNGIEQLLSLSNKPDIILLDDAFQHRKVKAGFYILLTAYNDLFTNDFMLPTGNLRESRSGARRANIIIITKCPRDISELEQNKIKEKIGVDKTVFFTFINYDDRLYSNNKTLNITEIKTVDKLLVAGIAKPESFFAYLQSKNDKCLVYPDHHHFSEKDSIDIKEKAKNRIIITTEKDFVRLSEKLKSDNLFYLPIKSSFVNNGNNFDEKIINYVGTSTTNS
ncbi:lipid-A-disaccharide kinase [Flavobacterium swingsii]|jgi:tetraacyldisaccharide 4'-kinase|uniref:Tetraacyldisaccharide 4'-kinase n=1 Tax=Flavobacterium swingsii TaxID=498292 RepID=A0A1I0VC95_9FLAO|nr:tetraacyldisaccharide 4'-kinase [Flavobacterium swingsii]SFA73858.1 lipid-A-disaccharide kinase [Flavobacterium swingsii]